MYAKSRTQSERGTIVSTIVPPAPRAPARSETAGWIGRDTPTPSRNKRGARCTSISSTSTVAELSAAALSVAAAPEAACEDGASLNVACSVLPRKYDD